MGILGNLFGKNRNKSQIQAVVQGIYDRMNPEQRDKVFYGDGGNAFKILHKLAEHTFGKADEKSVQICFDIYLHTWTRAHYGLSPAFSTPAYIRETLVERFSEYDKDTVIKCIDCSLSIIYMQEPELQQNTKAVAQLGMYVRENAAANHEVEKLNVDDPEYGLTPNKPVFVNGFGADKEYLAKLQTNDGKPLLYNRMGSMDVPGISGPVDIYYLSLPDGTKFKTIYICNYGSFTSDRPPATLSFR